MRTGLWLGVLGVLMASGCARGSTLHTFPATWPSSLEVGSPTQEATPSAPGPAVMVEPFTLDLGEATVLESPSDAPPTQQVLTSLFIEKLRSAGIRVAPPQAESPYLFRATISQLGFTVQGGYPRKIHYFSQLVYQLIRRQTGHVVWDGNVVQDFEQTVLVNTMTRLPQDPNAPERVLLEKCVEPTWQSVAADVGKYLETKTPD